MQAQEGSILTWMVGSQQGNSFERQSQFRYVLKVHYRILGKMSKYDLHKNQIRMCVSRLGIIYTFS